MINIDTEYLMRLVSAVEERLSAAESALHRIASEGET